MTHLEFFMTSTYAPYTGYGLSEITLATATKPPPGALSDRFKNVPGSTGILMPGVEARILREDGTEANFNEPGELWLRSGGTALGYKNNEEASRATFVDGWVKTGDRFLVDEDGTFFFHDRIKVRVMCCFYKCVSGRRLNCWILGRTLSKSLACKFRLWRSKTYFSHNPIN
jgi:acyl-CoA synthetase (AMP-forming)/AMP-acid ligase II